MALLFGDARSLRRWLLFGVLGCSAGIVGLSLTTRLEVAVPIVTFLSFSVSSLMGRIAQTVQHVVPPELRGRVMGIFAMAFTGLMPYASLGLSALADAIGFGAMLKCCSFLYAGLACGVLARVPVRPVAQEPVAAVPDPTSRA